MIEMMLAVVIDRAFLADDRYWPPPCSAHVCALTGLGGIVAVWEDHVDRHPGRLFVVRGVCASACEIAYRRAVARAERVVILPGARLIKHRPTRAVWQP